MESQKLRRVKNIDIRKGLQGYGFVISNQKPCIVSCVSKNGPAEAAGLKVNDEVLQVNGINVESMSHEEVVRMILRCSGSYVHLMVNIRNDTKNITDNTSTQETNADKQPSSPVSPVTPQRNSPGIGPTNSLRGSSPNSFSRTRPVSHADLAVRQRFKFKKQYSFDSASVYTNDTDSAASVCDDSDSNSKLKPSSIIEEEDETSAKLVSIEWQRDNVSLSRTLYPVLAPIDNDEVSKVRDYQVVVGYLCTIELPNESFLPTTSLNAITNCVKRLNTAGKKVNSTVLMTLSSKGVTLRNSNGVDIITYPLKTLAFYGTCPTDKRFFGLVTRKSLEPSPRKSPMLSPRLVGKRGAKKTIVCSCHVFLVDPELADHDTHVPIAEMFGIACARNTEFGGCKEFPPVSSVALYALNSLFRERKPSTDDALSDCEMGKTVSSTPKNSKQRAKSESGYSRNARRTKSTDELLQSTRDSDSEVRAIEKLKIKEELDSFKQPLQDDQRSSPSLFSRLKLKPKANKRTSKYSPKILPRTVSQDTGTRMYISSNKNKKGLGSLPSDVSDSCLSSLAEKRTDQKPVGNNMALIIDASDDCVVSEDDSPLTEEKEISFKSFIRESPLLRRKTRSKRKKVIQPESFSDSDFEFNSGLPRSGSLENDINASNCRVGMTEGSSVTQGWAKSLETLLADPVGIKYFQDFLKKEFSEENIIFWNACERLKILRQEEEVASLANQIYDQHLCHGAPLLVNVDQQAAKKAKEMLDKPSPNVFELQQQQIFKLMKFDSFPRFLKSDVYQQCLLLEEQGKLDPFDDDSRRGKTVWYIRKSKSNAKDLQDAAERKRSILGFLSKGKTGKQEVQGKQSRSHSVASFVDTSRRSSMASLPDLLEYRNSLAKLTDDANAAQSSDMVHPCRVLFPSGSSTFLPTDTKQTIRMALTDLCEKENTRLSAYEVFVGDEKEAIDMDKGMEILADKLIQLEKKVLFRFDLPNCRSVGVKISPSKTLREVLEPILKRNGYLMKDFVITLAGSRMPLNLNTKVQEMENKHLCAQSMERIRRLRQSTGAFVGKPPLGDFRSSIKRLRSNGKDEDTFLKPYPADLKPVRSEESLQRSSVNVGSKKTLSSLKLKEKNMGRKSRSKSVDLTEDAQADLVDVMVRTSSGRIDDQRGTIPKEELELPDFLKQNDTNTNESALAPTIEKQRSLSSGAVVSLAQQQELLDIDPNQFRPASEALADCSFQSVCERPSLLSVRSWSEIPTPDRLKVRASSPKASMLSKELDRELAFLGRLSVGSGYHGKENATSFEKAKGREEVHANSSRKNSFYISDDEEVTATSETLLETSSQWRSRQSSSDSLQSAESEDSDTELQTVPRCASTGSPRSPLQKQQKLDSNEDQPITFAVPESPVYGRKTLAERKLKPRPLLFNSKEVTVPLKSSERRCTEISVAAEESTLLDCKKENKEPAEMTRSMEQNTSVVPALGRPLKPYGSTTSSVNTPKPEITDSQGRPVLEDSHWNSGLKRSDSNVSDISVINAPVTATGSVNDETVVLEDKDMSLGLLNLIQRKRVNKCRRPQLPPSSQPEREKLLNGETIRGKKNERITFV